MSSLSGMKRGFRAVGMAVIAVACYCALIALQVVVGIGPYHGVFELANTGGPDVYGSAFAEAFFSASDAAFALDTFVVWPILLVFIGLVCSRHAAGHAWLESLVVAVAPSLWLPVANWRERVAAFLAYSLLFFAVHAVGRRTRLRCPETPSEV